MFAVPSPAQSGKGGTRTLALKVCTTFEENKDLRRVVDECFGNANSVDWNMHDQTHDITMSKMTPFDLTPEMANELAKYMIMAKAYDRVALPMFEFDGASNSVFDMSGLPLVVETFPSLVLPPHISLYYFNCCSPTACAVSCLCLSSVSRVHVIVNFRLVSHPTAPHS